MTTIATNADLTRTRLIASLESVEVAAEGNVARSRELQTRARYLRERLESGAGLIELIESEATPRMVELLSANLATLETTGAEFRAAEALALRAEGLTIEAIAELFGVTRQRISALLKQKAATE
jgi:hypothetical protein